MDKIATAVISLAEKHFENFKIRNGEVVPEYCPFCGGGEGHHDRGTFAVGLYNGMFQCLRGGCGKKGTFRQLLEHFGENATDFEEIRISSIGSNKTKQYSKPDPDELRPVTEDIITYFAVRKISEETVNAFKIASTVEGNIAFPFYRDGVLQYVKYRKPKKHVKADGPKEWSFPNGQPLLFGMDNVAFGKPLVITEGQIDAMSLYEAGVHNVVSVPCGCNNFDWIPVCWDWLERFQQIILFGDSDEPGIAMMQTLMKRLGEDRCMIAPQYPPFILNGVDKGRACKDANEILYVYGPEELKKLVDQCEPAPVEGVLNLSAIPFVDPSSVERIYTKIPALDQAIGGFGKGTLTIISGKRGEGKSTISGELMLNAIQQGYPVAAYSGELSAYNFREWIMCQACERKYITYKERNAKKYAMVPMEIQERIAKWLDGKFFLFDNTFVETSSMIDTVIKRFTMCARRYGCRMFLVDNLMMLTSGIEEEYKMQAKICAALKQFAVKFDAAVLLVAHPRKTPAGQAFNSEDIAGSAAISNLADLVMSIEKPNIRVTKNREFGDTPLIYCSFDPTNRRIFQTNIGDRTQYGWDHSGIQEPAERAADLPEFAIQHGASSMPF